MRRRRSIAREARLEGVGLHEGLPTRLTLRPAPEGSGVRFRRTDIAGSAPIGVHVSCREDRPRRTALVSGGVEVHTIEHLMAAVLGLGITDLDVEVDRVEVPGMDGSGAPFEAALREAGIVDLKRDADALALDRVVAVRDASGAAIVALPCPGRLVLDYTLDYGPGVRGRVEVDVDERTLGRELAPARTFCLEREALALRAAGLGRGATTQNTLVIGSDGLPLENRLRFPDEYVRHKALDLLGDLALLGVRLEARVLAYRAGHALNAELCRAIVKECMGAAGAHPRAGAEATEEVAGTDAATPVRVFRPHERVFLGHFPGDAVLPGVALLAAARAGAPAAAWEGVKFRRVVRPGEVLTIERAPLGDRRERVLARSGDDLVLGAVLERSG